MTGGYGDPSPRRRNSSMVQHVLRAARKLSRGSNQSSWESDNPRWVRSTPSLNGSTSGVLARNSRSTDTTPVCSPPKCPCGHALQLHIPETLQVWCNTCFAPIPGPSIGCRACVFDVCLDRCYETFFQYSNWMTVLLNGEWSDLVSSDDNLTTGAEVETLDTIILRCLWHSLMFDRESFYQLMNRIREESTNTTTFIKVSHILSVTFSVYCGMANELPSDLYNFFVDDLLKDARCDPTNDENRAIRMAARNGHLGLVNILLELPGIDPSSTDSYAFRKACAQGFTAVVKRLLEDGRVDPRASTDEPIRFACEDGHMEIVQMLLDIPTIDPTANDEYCAWFAAANCHLDILKLLLRDHRTSQESFDAAFLGAAQAGQDNVVQWLLSDHESTKQMIQQHVNIDFAISNAPMPTLTMILGHSLMTDQHWVIPCLAKKGYSQLLQQRLEMYPSRQQSTEVDEILSEALRYACEMCHVSVVEILLKDHRANPNWEAGGVFYVASVRGHHQVVQQLLMDDRVGEQLTPRLNMCLKVAAERGHSKVVELLCVHPLVDSAQSNCAVLLSAVVTCDLSTILLLLQQPEVLEHVLQVPPLEQPPIISKVVRRNRPYFVRALLYLDCSSCATVKQDSVTILQHREDHKLPLRTKLMTARHLHPGAKNNKAFTVASHGVPVNIEIMQLFLRDPRVKPSKKQMGEALQFACAQGYTEVVKMYVLEAQWRKQQLLEQPGNVLQFAPNSNQQAPVIQKLLKRSTLRRKSKQVGSTSNSISATNVRSSTTLASLQHLARRLSTGSSTTIAPRTRRTREVSPNNDSAGLAAPEHTETSQYSELEIDPNWHHQTIVRAAVRNAQYETARYLNNIPGTRWGFGHNLCVRITATRGMLVSLLHATKTQNVQDDLSNQGLNNRQLLRHQVIVGLLPMEWRFTWKHMVKLEKAILSQPWMLDCLRHLPSLHDTESNAKYSFNEHETFAMELLDDPEVLVNGDSNDVPLAYKWEWLPVMRLLQIKQRPAMFSGVMALADTASACGTPMPPSILQEIVEDWLPLVCNKSA